jgi:hypothetical protein
MNRNLVLARVGGNSLHHCWIDRGQARDWDLYLSPYQAMPAQAELDCVVGNVIPGPKWSGLREVLNGWDGWRDYDYIWMPDDDLLASQQTVSRMFQVARSIGLDLFAPALHESSYFAHFSTMKNHSFYGRRVGFVEIMMPGFSTAALEELLPTLDLTQTGWGWGLDSLWPKLLGYENVGVIDGVAVVHTRPVGRMRDEQLARRVHAESDAILATHECGQLHSTFSAFDAELTPIDLTPEGLLAELVRGWQYLIESDPRVLSWLMDYQKPHFEWPEYPIAGTPS